MLLFLQQSATDPLTMIHSRMEADGPVASGGHKAGDNATLVPCLWMGRMNQLLRMTDR